MKVIQPIFTKIFVVRKRFLNNVSTNLCENLTNCLVLYSEAQTVGCDIHMVKVKLFLYWHGQTPGFQESETARFHGNQHMKVVKLSALRTAAFTPKEIYMVLISVTA